MFKWKNVDSTLCSENVDLEIIRTHSVNYEKPLRDVQFSKGKLNKLKDGTYIISFESCVGDEPFLNNVKVLNDVASFSNYSDNTRNRQIFKKGASSISQFSLNGKVLDLRNKTKRIDYHFNEEGGFIDIFYELYSGETHLGFYSLEIMVGE
jgi:hypothetical protein